MSQANKSHLVSEYNETKKKFDKLSDKIGKYFMSLAKKALAKDDLDLAISLMEECPDFVTKVFIADAINQHKSKI